MSLLPVLLLTKPPQIENFLFKGEDKIESEWKKSCKYKLTIQQLSVFPTRYNRCFGGDHQNESRRAAPYEAFLCSFVMQTYCKQVNESTEASE